MDTARTLAASRLFRGLTPGECLLFAPLAREQEVRRGEYLFRLGQPASALLVVVDGTVELTMPLAMPSGERDVVVEEVGPGETAAWSALIEPHQFTMSARAGTDVSLLAFPRDELRQALLSHTEPGVRVLANLAGVIGRRLHLMQAMWSRELQRAVTETFG
jgi:CRP-like cAMP-binding protein